MKTDSIKKLKPVEMITVILSITSIFLSSLAIYFQFFHETRALTATLVKMNPRDDFIEYKFVFSNNGTETYVISECEAGYNYRDNGYDLIPCETSPIIVKPNETLLHTIKLQIPAGDSSGKLDHDVTATSKHYDHQEIFIDLNAVGADGYLIRRRIVATKILRICEELQYSYPVGVWNLTQEPNSKIFQNPDKVWFIPSVRGNLWKQLPKMKKACSQGHGVVFLDW